MRSKFLLAMALIMVVAAGFATIGMAYTASTENSGNTVTSDYIILDQFNYTLSSENGPRFDVVTTEAGDVYQIRNVVPLIEIDGASYSGFLVGQDQLTSHVVGSDKSDLAVAVTTSGYGIGVGFTPFEDYQDWRYVLKVEYNRFIVLFEDGYSIPLSDINVVKVGSNGVPSLQTGCTVNDAIPGNWKVWGNSAPGNYTVKESDVCTINGSKFIVLVDKDVVVSNYNIVKLKNTSPTFEIGLSAGTELGTWKVWGASPAAYSVQDSDAYPKTVTNSTQYAYFDGTGVGDSVEWKVINPESVSVLMNKTVNDAIPGSWKVWGYGDINTDYSVIAGDGYKKFILLMDSNCRFSGLTVIKVTKSGNDYLVSYETSKKDGDVITGSWKKWNEGASGNYTISSSDSKNGFIVITSGDFSVGSNKYAVIELKNRLDITKDITYTTTLYFAGPSKDPKALLRSADTVVNTSSDIRIDADWESFESGEGYKITLKPNTDDGGVGSDYVYYTGNDHSLVLPENMFTNSNASKKFVGWKDADLGKVYSPWYVFGETEQDRTLIAQWSTTYLTVTFSGGAGSGTMPISYVVSGNTFTLPLCSYTAPTSPVKMFTGWLVEGASSRDYSSFDQPMETITNLTENITVTAQWSEIPAGCHKVTIDGMEYNVYTDENGRYTLPHNIFLPPSNPYIEEFTGWVFSGWKVTKATASKMVAQGHSDPISSNFYIIEHGVIKFKYDSREVEP